MKDLIVQPGAQPDAPLSIFIMGPTASGKTDLALAIHEHYPVDLISVDSALVYRGMDIGTAKPDAETLRQAPHQLIDIIEPDEVYSAGQFCEDALSLIAQSVDQQRIPLLVGGTMLYFNALQKGMADMPDVPESVKQAIDEEAKHSGMEAMHDRLRRVDPVSADVAHADRARGPTDLLGNLQVGSAGPSAQRTDIDDR